MLQLFGLPPVICIQKGNVSAFCCLHACVSGSGRTSVLGLYQKAYPLIRCFRKEPLHHCPRIVTALVLHQNQFPAPVGLGLYGRDGFQYIFFRIVNRYNNTDQSFFVFHNHPSAPAAYRVSK